MHKKTMMGIFGFITLLFSSFAYSANVVYVDVEYALATTKAGKKAKEEMDKQLKQRNEMMEKTKKDIMKLEEDYKKQELVLTEKKKNEKKEEYLKKVENFKNLGTKSQQEMQELEQKLANPILTKMKEIIQKLSKEKGYEMVVTKNALVYADEKQDITKDLIERFDKEYKN